MDFSKKENPRGGGNFGPYDTPKHIYCVVACLGTGRTFFEIQVDHAVNYHAQWHATASPPIVKVTNRDKLDFEMVAVG